MTNNVRPNDFATRLQRIGETKQSDAPQEPVQAERPTGSSSYGPPPQESHFIRNTLIWLVIIAAVGAGGFVVVQALPQNLKDLAAGLFGDSDATTDTADALNTEAPAPVETDELSDQGAIVQTPLVARLQAEPITLNDIATGVTLPTGETQVGAVIPFNRNVTCTLRRPLATEQVMNVRVETGLLPTPLQAFSDAQLADQLLKNVEAVTQGGKTYDPAERMNGTLSGIDVFVTDTSAPIYLVLQNMGAGILWNIHTAPDVTVAHVAIVSSSHSGLVSPPNNATFDALLVSDFVGPHTFGADDEVRDCMIRPWRTPQPEWIGTQKANTGDVVYENEVSSYTKGYAAYNSWFTATLGIDAGTNVIAPRDAAHVLVGPTPTAPISYRSIAGQDIHLMQTDNIFVGNPATRTSQTKELHTQLLLAAIGGDTNALNPAPIERAAP